MFSLRWSWNLACRIARWLMVATLIVFFAPIAICFLIAIFAFLPKGHVWANYWGHLLAEGTKGIWYSIFGPQRVRIHRPHRRHWRGRYQHRGS